MAADPVRQPLAPADLRVGQAGGAEHGDEDLRRPHLAGRRVDHRQRLPGEVDEQLVAGEVGLAHGQRHAAAPGGVEVAEPAVAVALGVLGPVFLPQQQQRHPGAAQLGMDPRPVGLRPQRLPRREGRAEQPRLQRGIVQPGRHRPGDADHRRAAKVLGDRVAADADRGGDLPLALAAGVLEAKDFSNLAHGQSLGGHGSPRRRCRTEPAPVDDCPQTAPQPLAGVAGLRRNRWLACAGFSGWLPSESPAAFRRNTHSRPRRPPCRHPRRR